ncbi:sensor histidine kinase [Herbaspirillum huttiense]|jgi:signal transduction histidine kinase|uniref:histidine kinase n=2 Tax=Pseudomonadota TaxID=1224 RepID=A0ABU2ERE9_9BURK|nr:MULTISPECIES: ATP-binding protein [Herbaspirillum]MAF03452.1 sensor histidine kinase [Herbaspirillum sp.]MBN9355256.1 HAMP domain-containing histidine kinase [Herbaspirillum huttiense]MBO14030.1 sensor histidine kinase [Herbaspirillum sp.]MBP1315026.1 signal transduction histidine kinase [Herbaspirillum sp. 1130]MCP3658317.1 HAMP domain-containing histidine kinase [Herbaspirillum sp.]|tara:strand:+ start:3322 stop:3927 length:606 start_codon:yes stop_codon:yes gene_type:complete
MDPKLAAIIIHDIKNSLGVLEGELRRLSDDVPRVQQAHVTCLALQEKLIAFLTLYKADSQGLRAQVEAVSPLDFLDALVREHGVSRSNDIALQVDETDMPVIGFFDEHLVALALEAALQNASRFARSQIALGCRKHPEGGVIFTVRDDGPGIGTQEKKPSTGLGMDLCNAIATAHNKETRHGEARLSNHPDGGALFELCLP